jgi:mannose/cellobiose epimerase-like protein (N-acyl-D-glucosamine 2-epimerase family)
MPQIATAFQEARLRPWLRDILLPFWATTGFDSVAGAFVEKFEPSGAPTAEGYTRVRVQARQIFVFSHAAVAGYSDAGLDRATRAFAFLEDHAWDRQHGGWFHRLALGGAALDRSKDSYDHAFLLLAMAWLYRAGGDAQVLRRAAAPSTATASNRSRRAARCRCRAGRTRTCICWRPSWRSTRPPAIRNG